MTRVVELPGDRAASYHVIGDGTPALMFAGGPGLVTAALVTALGRHRRRRVPDASSSGAAVAGAANAALPRS